MQRCGVKHLCRFINGSGKGWRMAVQLHLLEVISDSPGPAPAVEGTLLLSLRALWMCTPHQKAT